VGYSSVADNMADRQRYVRDSCTKLRVYGVGQFNCVSEICRRPTLVATVTKNCKFSHKIYINQLVFKIGPRVLHLTESLAVIAS